MKSEKLKRAVLMIFLNVVVLTFMLDSFNAVHSGEKITASGIVIVSKDSEGNLISVRLMAEDMDGFNIKLDAIGVKLAEEMHRKWVELTGIIENDGKEYWVEVESYREITEGVTEKREFLGGKLFYPS